MKKRRGIFTKEEAKLAPKKLGIYFILASKSFSRLRGRTNIVYIGETRSKTLFERLVGRRDGLYRFEKLRNNGFKLRFKCRIAKDKTPREMEVEALQKYEKQHLELPPLNHSN